MHLPVVKIPLRNAKLMKEYLNGALSHDMKKIIVCGEYSSKQVHILLQTQGLVLEPRVRKSFGRIPL